MAIKLKKEQTYGTHIYMQIQLDDMRIEEIDVYFREDVTVYQTSADHGIELCRTEEEKMDKLNLREKIIAAFNTLY